MDKEQPVVIVKEDKTAIKVVTIFGLLFASPLIAVFGFLTVVSVVAIVFGTMHSWVPYLLLIALIASLVPGVRERLSGKHGSKGMEERLQMLERELSDARQQILTLEEGADFHQKLKTGEHKLPEPKQSSQLHLKAPEEQR